MSTDIIAAFATPVGTSGLQVMRVAGAGSAKLCDHIFNFGPLPELNQKAKVSKRSVDKLQGYQAAFGYLHEIDNPDAPIDQCVLTKFRKGKSYTGEEQVEISIHGGNALRKQVLNLVLEAGARLAEPGEFTKWAFLNGKVDLSQAEAVMDLIEADTSRQHDAAIRHLQGDTAKELSKIKDNIYELLSSIEVDIEYPEYEDFALQTEMIDKNLSSAISKLREIMENNKQGEVLREGLQLVIVGEPNVGKSSLLNALAGEDRAIVTDIAGTTRDSIDMKISLAGIPVTLYDTAGIRHTDDPIELEGVNRAKKLLNNADLLLFVLDLGAKTDEDNLEAKAKEAIEEFIDLSAQSKDFFIVFNKLDLSPDLEKQTKDWQFLKDLAQNNPQYQGNLWISAKEQEGIKQLQDLIVNYYENLSGSGATDLIVTSIRQQNLIKTALKQLEQVYNDKDFLPTDILASGLRQALEVLGEITGEDVSENMINDIFSRFCIGK